MNRTGESLADKIFWGFFTSQLVVQQKKILSRESDFEKLNSKTQAFLVSSDEE